ncbi:MAG: hypothetical protein LBC88_00375 [Spirochaetaceae bacterium]|jgi:ribonucleoside-triphosphate reductase|nr:hypothetical protein [Spirochaetaceae bacterium]
MMRTLEAIDKDLAAAREALSHAEGTPAEVYSRIVGYYRSVRNWNKGKREEYGERKLFLTPEETRPDTSPSMAAPMMASPLMASPMMAAPNMAGPFLAMPNTVDGANRLLLFVRDSCPRCPGAKDAAGSLGIPVDLINADTEDGMAEAVRRQVFSTPTAILLSPQGEEQGRALDAGSIERLIAV